MSSKEKDIEQFDKKHFFGEIGQQIKKVRIKKKMSASKLAEKALMERSHIARIEMGNTNPTVTTLQTLCDAMDITLDDLFDGFTY